jgi:hypothetical protein
LDSFRALQRLMTYISMCRAIMWRMAWSRRAAARCSCRSSIRNCVKEVRTAVRPDDGSPAVTGVGARSNNGFAFPEIAVRSIPVACETAGTGQLAADTSELMIAALALRMRARSSSACAAMRASPRTSASAAATTEPVASAAISDANASTSAAHFPE